MTDDVATCFACEGCGFPFFTFSPRPRSGFCPTCAWVDETTVPELVMPLRRRCEPGGWESERERRGVVRRGV